VGTDQCSVKLLSVDTLFRITETSAGTAVTDKHTE
jgi:hypothetical protein